MFAWLLRNTPSRLLDLVLPTVHRARTAEELEAIHRFRYTVYAAELGRLTGGADPSTRTVRDAEDDDRRSLHFYAGTPDDIRGVIRLRLWGPDDAPPGVAAMLSLDRFGDVFTHGGAAEFGRLMVRADQRGGPVLLAMVRAVCVEIAAARCRAVFATCRPGLAPFYCRLGMRPYGGRLYDGPDGIEIPLLLLPEYGRLRAMGSPMTGLMDELYGRAAMDDPWWGEVLAHVEGQAGVPVLDPAAAADELQANVDRMPGFFSELSPEATRRLGRRACLFDVPAGTTLLRRGQVEREVYLLLAGRFEVRVDGRVLATRTAGDLVGEMASYSPDGTRCADVVAVEDGRVAVLRRGFLAELAKADATVAKRAHEGLADTAAVRRGDR